MSFLLRLPFAVMEALPADEIPSGGGWLYEPKWDGFRCLASRDGERVALQSKAGKDLTRYFPEIVSALLRHPARKFVVDGELMIPSGVGFSFDDLLQRIHPSAGRVEKLSSETPAILVLFDLLAEEKMGRITALPLQERRERLERFVGRTKHPSIRLSPVTSSVTDARRWSRSGGSALDGVMAKRAEMPYRSGGRDAVLKIKSLRTADCVVGGFRYGEHSSKAASLLLGLYDEAGALHHVGYCPPPGGEDRDGGLTSRLERLIEPPGFTGSSPGGPSRWSGKRSSAWKPLEPSLVAEIRYDHFSGGRFRHGTKFLRWRPDKAPAQCGFEQVERPESRAANLLRRYNSKMTNRR